MSQKTSDIDISYVAYLARLQLTEVEAARFSAQLKDILKYVEKLNELDVTNVEPILTRVAGLSNVLRKDEVQPSIASADVLRNAPQQARSLFIVPKIVEQG
jgi:aspartyl-tRNA(Asn)/glutamyl-tRNA(Gln) amidotransferase subunit C